MSPLLPPLYAIVDVELCRVRGLDPLTVLAAFVAGGARFIQLRDKSPSSGARLALADAAVALTRPAGARLVINDRADIARMCGADGVHVGQDDLPVAAARRIVGAETLLGVSTHDEAQLQAAMATDADYVAVGPIYGTATKSGSARIRRCSGMEVLIPSMTVISSVRRIRAMASCRSRPCTMILAIIES